MRATRFARWWVAAAISVVLFASPARASDVQVAVAANFAQPMKRIAEAFGRDTGHRVVVVTGATGTFFAQIEQGAPFDVFLAADQATPERLVVDGFAVGESRFTYGLGVLVLWSARAGYVDAGGAVLSKGDFRHLAIANPKLAPYGVAAINTLESLGLLDGLRPKLVQGQSIAQAVLFVASGNAELGFVALSQVAAPDAPLAGSYWVVPADLYPPITQDAVLLKRGTSNPAANALCQYLKGTRARDIIRSYGYELPAAAGR
jgi:molybdate transport system substrate-binding protein